MDVKEILKHVDHTLLKQTATWEDIREICDDGIKYGCASVCIPQTYVNHAAHYVAEQQHFGFGQLPICTVIGFPNGYTPSGIKCMEAESAIADGATEIDMVINLGWVKEGQYDKILQEINSVKISCHGNILKVIIETCLLTDEEKIKLCEVVSASHADYIKTSTGFAGGGATREDVALMVKHMTGGKKVKVTECRVAESHGEAPGTVLATKPLTVACGEGAIQLLHVVPEGKKPMDGTSFAAGLRLRAGDSL